MTDSDVINECREFVAANEAAAEEYLSRYFVIQEHTLRELKTTMLSEFLYMPVEDIEKTPGISYSKTIQLPPIVPNQPPEAVVHMSWLNIPEHLSNLRCYRLSPRMSVAIPPDKPRESKVRGVYDVSPTGLSSLLVYISYASSIPSYRKLYKGV